MFGQLAHADSPWRITQVPATKLSSDCQDKHLRIMLYLLQRCPCRRLHVPRLCLLQQKTFSNWFRPSVLGWTRHRPLVEASKHPPALLRRGPRGGNESSVRGSSVAFTRVCLIPEGPKPLPEHKLFSAPTAPGRVRAPRIHHVSAPWAAVSARVLAPFRQVARCPLMFLWSKSAGCMCFARIQRLLRLQTSAASWIQTDPVWR